MASGQVRARAKFREHDGIVRPVTRYGPTKAAAERRLKGAIRDRKGPIGDGEITSESRFREIAERWLEEVSDTGLADGGVETYERNLERHVITALGDLRIREITVGRVDKFLKDVRARRGVSAAKKSKTVASLVLGIAVRHDALDHNPVRDVAKVKREKRSTVRALTAGKAKGLLKRVAGEAGKGMRGSDELDLHDVVSFMR